MLTRGRAIIISAVSMVAVIAILAAARIDISAARDLRQDPIAHNSAASSRSIDPAPWAIWVPIDLMVWDSVRAGQLPLWDRMQGGGYSPLLALRGTLHPLRWLTGLVPRESAPSALIVLALYLAAFGAYLCAREFGFEKIPSAFAAVLFVVSPPIIALAQNSGALLPVAHFPWLLFFYRRAMARQGLATVSLLAALFASMLMSGDPFMGVSIVLCACVFAFLEGIASGRIRPLIVMLFGALLGALLTSVAFLPPLFAASDSVAGGVTTAMDGVTRYNVQAWPSWWKTMERIVFAVRPAACCVDSPSQSTYVGIFVALLLAAAVAAARRRGPTRNFLLLTAVWLFLVIPPPLLLPLRFVRLFNRIPTVYYGGAFALAMAVAAAGGLAFLFQRGGIVRRIGVAIAVTAIAVYAWRAYGILRPRPWQPVVTDAARALQTQPRGRIIATSPAVHRPNVARLTGMEDVRIAASPLVSHRYFLWRQLVARDPSRWLAEFNVTHVVAPDGTVRLNAAPARPRAHFAERAITVVDLADATRILMNEPHAAANAVVVEKDDYRDDLPAVTRGRVTVHYPDDRHVVLETDSDTGGLVVLHDAYDRGWRASVDGRALNVYAVNFLSRGVVVPKGRYRVEMRYVPLGLAEGAAMSCVTLLGLAALVIVRRHRHVIESGQTGAQIEALIDRLLEGARRVSVRRGAWTIVFVFAAVLAIMIIARIDISAARGFHGDVLVRDAFSNPPPDRYHDLSPMYIWLPSDWFVWDSVRSGHLPLWDRMQGGGYSPLVTIQNGVLHPIRWLMAFVPRDAVPTALIVFALFVAFLGTYLLVTTEMHLSVPSGVIAAVVYTFSGPLASVIHFSGGLLPLTHLPWLILLLRRTLRTRERVSFALLAAGFTSLVASGHPLIIFTVVFAVVIFACAETLSMSTLRPATVTAVVGGIAVPLSAYTLLPPYVSLPDVWTYKSVTPDGINYMPSDFQGWNGSLWRMLFDTCKRGHCWPDDLSFYTYAGLAALLLAALGVYVAIRKRQHLSYVIAAAIFFLLGIPGPWMWLIADIPPFNYCKAWYLLGPFGLFLGTVCAIGYDTLVRSQRRDAHAGVFVLAILLATSYGPRLWNTYQPQRWQSVAVDEAYLHVKAQAHQARITGLWGLVHQANSSRITGIEDVRFSGPIISRRYHEWWAIVDPKVLRRSFPTTRMTDQLWSPMVPDFNINTILESRFPPFGSFKTIFWRPRRDKRRSPHTPKFPLTMETYSLRVYARPGARPRAHFAERVMVVPDLEAAKSVLSVDRGTIVATTAIVESPQALGNVPEHASGFVRLSYPSERLAVMETDSATGGVVVLHDTYARGWMATVDGRNADVLPVNILSRGVVVPPGRHKIEMWYVPPGLVAGVLISLGTFLALVAWCAIAPKKQKNDAGAGGE